MAPSGLIAQLSVQKTGENEFTSQNRPRALGNAAQIGYGGNTLGVAVLAAYSTVTSQFHLFSIMGSFLGPARIDRKLHCRVTSIRNTKTFSTRRVVAYQIQDDGSQRSCADVTLDFHVREQGVFEYSAAPNAEYFSEPEDPAKTASTVDITAALVRDGKISKAVFDAWSKTFKMYSDFFEGRQCLASVSGQNPVGLAKDAITTQEHLHITQKSTAEWTRAREPIQNLAEHMAALVFVMDGGLSFLPLTLDHKNLGDAGACSTLEFSLRILVPDIKMDDWNMNERKTIAAHGARTYSEARLWDRSGRIIAVMSQTSILRPPVRKQDASSKL